MPRIANKTIAELSDEDVCLMLATVCDCASQTGALLAPNDPRWPKLSIFIHFWRRELLRYSVFGVSPLLTDHDMMSVISSLETHCCVPKDTLGQELVNRIPNASNINGLIHLGVRLMLMAHNNTVDIGTNEYGNHQVPWFNESLKDFIVSWFPTIDHHIFSHPSHPLYDGLKSELKARKLKKHLKAHLWPTDNIMDHLKFDRQRNVIFIFHHAGFVKEQLRLTKLLTKTAPPEASIRL